MDLRDAAVLNMTEVTDQSNDVKAKLMMWQGEAGLRFGSEGLMKPRARGVRAASNVQDKLDDTIQGRDNAKVVVSGAELVSTFRTVPGYGRELQRVFGAWTGSRSHG